MSFTLAILTESLKSKCLLVRPVCTGEFTCKLHTLTHSRGSHKARLLTQECKTVVKGWSRQKNRVRAHTVRESHRLAVTAAASSLTPDAEGEVEGPANSWPEQTWALLVLQCTCFGISYFIGCNGIKQEATGQGLLQNAVFLSNSYYLLILSFLKFYFFSIYSL